MFLEARRLEDIYRELDLEDFVVVVSENIPESILSSAAKMVVYLNFIPPTKVHNFFFKLFPSHGISVKQLIISRFLRKNFFSL